MKPKVGIIGDGNVGSKLREGLERRGYDVRACGKEPTKVREIAQWSELIFLAIPFSERQNAVNEMQGAYRGKTVVDVTNALNKDYSLAVEPTRESGAEQLQRMCEGAKIVKAFNTVFAQHMDSGKVNGEKITLFVAGDDGASKDEVRDIGRELGFDAIDSGPLKNARWMETLGYFNIQLGHAQKMGSNIGFKLVH